MGAASWIFNGVIGTPSLHLPFERWWRVLPSAYLHQVPLYAQLRRASQDFQQKFQS